MHTVSCVWANRYELAARVTKGLHYFLLLLVVDLTWTLPTDVKYLDIHKGRGGLRSGAVTRRPRQNLFREHGEAQFYNYNLLREVFGLAEDKNQSQRFCLENGISCA